MVVSSLFGYILHYALLMETVQAWTLVSNSGHAFQQRPPVAFPGTDAVIRMPLRAAAEDT